MRPAATVSGGRYQLHVPGRLGRRARSKDEVEEGAAHERGAAGRERDRADERESVAGLRGVEPFLIAHEVCVTALFDRACAVERARQNGRWDAAYDPASTATVPEDLQAALDASERADAFFKTLSGANRYALLFRIQTAKKPETRARRMQEFIAMLERGEKLYP